MEFLGSKMAVQSCCTQTCLLRGKSMRRLKTKHKAHLSSYILPSNELELNMVSISVYTKIVLSENYFNPILIHDMF